jgi:fatty acid-binding protein DegV
MTPIVCTDAGGRIALAGFLFGQRVHIAKFARFVARRVPSGPTEIGIGHAVCRADAEEMANELRTRIPNIMKLTVCGLGTGLGVHGGPGTMIISVRPYLSAKDIAGCGD